MKFPSLTRVTAIHGVETPGFPGRFSEVVIAGGSKEVRLTCDPNSDELRLSTQKKKKGTSGFRVASGVFHVEWMWSMTNQQGYSDGFRIQLRSKKERRVFDFISAASAIDIFEARQTPNQTLQPTPVNRRG